MLRSFSNVVHQFKEALYTKEERKHKQARIHDLLFAFNSERTSNNASSRLKEAFNYLDIKNAKLDAMMKHLNKTDNTLIESISKQFERWHMYQEYFSNQNACLIMTRRNMKNKTTDEL